MMLSCVDPSTTRVENRAPAPSTASAASAVTSFVVEAGVDSWVPSSDRSTRPVTASATSIETWGPTTAGASGPASADRSPLAVGSGPVRAPGASTVPGPATGPASTEATRKAASRAGSMRATATPAASVNTLIMANVTRAAILVRRTVTYLNTGGVQGGMGGPDRPSHAGGVQGGRPPRIIETMELTTRTGLERTIGN